MGGGEKGRVDLLLKFFDSQTHFNSWVALTYLYKSTSSPGVTDYLCNRLYTLPEEQVEVYLSQLCQLIVNRPNSPLERVVVDLCARSLRVAVKVGTLQRGNLHVCEAAWHPAGDFAASIYWGCVQTDCAP